MMKKWLFRIVIFLPLIIMTPIVVTLPFYLPDSGGFRVLNVVLILYALCFLPIWVHYLDTTGKTEKIMDFLGIGRADDL